MATSAGCKGFSGSALFHGCRACKAYLTYQSRMFKARSDVRKIQLLKFTVIWLELSGC